MRYKVRINCDEHDISPERWPTLEANYKKAVGVAKPWIDAGYLVEITAIPGEDEDEYENEYEDIAAPYVPLVGECMEILRSRKEVGNGD